MTMLYCSVPYDQQSPLRVALNAMDEQAMGKRWGPRVNSGVDHNQKGVGGKTVARYWAEYNQEAKL